MHHYEKPSIIAGYEEDGCVFAKFPSLDGWRIIASDETEMIDGEWDYEFLISSAPFKYEIAHGLREY